MLLASRSPTVAGGSLALLAAVAFGLTTPFIQRAGSGVGPFATACLLYAGAAMFAALPARARPRDDHDAPVTRHHIPRLAVVAILGALVAPVALAWGLQRTRASSASLLLNFEAVLTVILARLLYGEPIGRRIAVVVALMALGGALLVVRSRDALVGADVGAGAVLVAAFAWAADSALTRPLADLDTGAVVRWKSLLGATMSLAGALLFHETHPSLLSACALLACGAVGYGASLRLYLRAQRVIGAARTGSIFAAAPFIGAGAAWVLGDRDLGASSVVAALLFSVAVALQLTERHRHSHQHEALEHAHAHRHDDGHHDHAHHPAPDGEHSHTHRHDPRAHAHEHAPDIHHRHEHR